MSSLLSPLEQDILLAFFQLEEADEFVLTGGAALAEFYFQHRLSNDLDLFTLNDHLDFGLFRPRSRACP